jgi:hypothetical protein
MIAGTVEERFRRFLLIVSAFIFGGTMVELWFTEHTGDLVQLVPFVLCGLGICIVVAALFAPKRGVLFALRAIMALLVLGSMFGIYQHVEHNYGFEVEIRPNASRSEAFWEALSGASPLLAPGILALGGMLAIAATYYHPVLKRSVQTEVR